MIHLLFQGKKGDLDPFIQQYIKRSPGVSAIYQKKLEPKSKFVIGLDERGKSLSTLEFAKLLEKQSFRLDLVVGDDQSLPKYQYNLLVNVSPFVLPHDMVRLIVTEQVYRAISIFEGHPYHHA